MIILVNGSVIKKGGAVQVYVNFIRSSSIYIENIFFIVNKIILPEIEELVSKHSKNFFIIDQSPSHPIYGYKSRKMLKKIEKEVNPTFVYSIGYPSYVRFTSLEIGRLTNPWLIFNIFDLPWNKLPLKQKIIYFITILYQSLLISKDSILITQTEFARISIARRYYLFDTNIFVIPNSPGERFFLKKHEDLILDRFSLPNSIFCISADYYHKNLEIIPLVAYNLKKMGLDEFTFYITLDFNSPILELILKKAIRLNVSDKIINLGKLKLNELNQYYSMAKICFFPTLLEVSSVSFIEASSYGIPIIASKNIYNYELCGEFAAYFENENHISAAESLNLILCNRTLFESFSKKSNDLWETHKNKDVVHDSRKISSFYSLVNNRFDQQ